MATRSMTARCVALLLAVVLGVAGCGDDDAEGDDGADATTTSAVDAIDDEGDDVETPSTEPAAEGEDASSTTTAPADVPAETDPPIEDPGEGDGFGDPLVFVADLSGDAEVPPGDPAGSGRIEIESAVQGEWCIDMVATGLGAVVTDSHIHFGPEGINGAVVIPIGAPTSSDGDTDTWDDVCVTVEDDLAAEVIDAPDAFYANVHTADFPGGAVRGQLAAATIFDLTLS